MSLDDVTGWWLSAFALALLRVEVAGRRFAARSAAGPSARWATVHGTIVCLNVSHDLFSPSVYSYKANQATQEDEWLTHTDKHTQTAQLSLLGEKQAGGNHVWPDRICAILVAHARARTPKWGDAHKKCNCSPHSWGATYLSAHERAKRLRKLQPRNLPLLNGEDGSHTLTAQKLFHRRWIALEQHAHTGSAWFAAWAFELLNKASFQKSE